MISFKLFIYYICNVEDTTGSIAWKKQIKNVTTTCPVGFQLYFIVLIFASEATETTLPPPGLCERIEMMTLYSNYTESVILPALSFSRVSHYKYNIFTGKPRKQRLYVPTCLDGTLSGYPAAMKRGPRALELALLYNVHGNVSINRRNVANVKIWP